jgi:signal transduction histidine kinase
MWPLIVVTVAIVAFFVGSAMYSQRIAARLDEDAASIATNASPSIEALSAARGAALRAEVAVARAFESAPRDDAQERLSAEEALTQLRAYQQRYLSLPFYPDEREQWTAVDEATHDFEREIAVCFAAIARGRMDEAREILTGKLRPATEVLDQRLESLVGFNATQQHRMGMEIPRLRRHAARATYVLNAASALLAILLIALVVRESRRRQRLLARFSSRLEEIVAATARITSTWAHGGDQRAVLHSIVEEANQLIDADYAALGFIVDPAKPFEPFVFHGMSPETVTALGHFPRPVGVLGSVIAQGDPVRVDDVASHPRFGGFPKGHPAMGAFLGVPVRRDGRGAGNLYLARKPGRPAFTEQDEHVIQLLATQAAISTENARLYDELKEQRMRANLLADASGRMVGSLDYESTLELAAQAALPEFADLCILHVTDDKGAITRMVMAAHDPAWRLVLNELNTRQGEPLARPMVLRTLRERRPVRFAVDQEFLQEAAEDVERRTLMSEIPMRSGLSVPMIGRARVLGLITFFTFGDEPFDEADVRFAEEIARRAALSIDNAILHHQARRAVQAREDLLAMVSHDLRSPLGSVRMASGLLKRDAARDEQKRVELANRIERTTSVILHLIEDLLSASKIESGSFSVEPKREAVESLVGEAIDSFRDAAAAKSIAFHAEVDPAASEVVCDRHRCLQVFSNLIGNALKFTPAEGTITLSAHSLGAEVQFAVCDSGPGIPEAEREHIFDRYWQASHSRRAGAGLGLFIVKGIVEAHGGRAWVESRGGGACLCFTLPSALPSIADPAGVPTRH